MKSPRQVAPTSLAAELAAKNVEFLVSLFVCAFVMLNEKVCAHGFAVFLPVQPSDWY